MIAVGVDLVNVPRFAKALARWGDRLKTRLFSPAELADYCGREDYNNENLASVFAAKEAFLKALGTGLADGISWHDVQVVNDPAGAPGYAISGRAGELFRGNSALSLAHEGDYAIAVCVLEKEVA